MQKISHYFKENKIDIIFLILLTFFLPLFLYNLGGSSLADFDEAWYAEISRKIIVDKHPFLLSFNEVPYRDHPPLGFILMALSFLLFGVGEYAARLPSALLGFGSVILLFYIGKYLFNRMIGIGASLVLVSTVWFILRARTGNLDTPFLFFYLLTLFFALKVKENLKWLYAFSISIALLLLTKSLIGLTILLPTLPIIFITFYSKKIFPLKNIITSILLFFIILAPWLITNYQNSGFYFIRHLIQVGLRSPSGEQLNILDILNAQTITYLHFGIREWFYPAIIAVIGSIFFTLNKPTILILYVWLLVLLYGFLSNSKTEIWHLIPLYPILGLFISFFLYRIIVIITRTFQLIQINNVIQNKIKISKKMINLSMNIIFLSLILVLTFKQIYEFRHDIKLYDKNLSSLAYTSSSARNISGKLYLDNSFFLPSAVFYSQQKVYHLQSQDSPKNTLDGLLNGTDESLNILTEKYRIELENININEYRTISELKGHILIEINAKNN